MNNDRLTILKEYVPALSDAQLDQFMRYYEMLIETNRVMNLTAITDFDEVVIKHFADSLAISLVFADTHKKDEPSLLDVGTGAGFPGIPIKIAYPEMHVTLIDSLGKRVNFLQQVIDELDLGSTGSMEAVHSRAEDYVHEPGIRESFDYVTSRAVASLNVLSEYALPYVIKGGYFIAYKSERSEEEMNDAASALKILGGEISKIHGFTLPGSDIGRTLISIKKTCPSPDKYPRKAGLPSKKPL